MADLRKNSHAWIGLVALVPLVVPRWADAADAVRFDIPRQRADTALTSFARQSGIPVLFPYDTVSQRTANRLSGEYPIGEGLRILLDGTGLEAVTRAGRQITVRSSRPRPRPLPPDRVHPSAPQSADDPVDAKLDEVTITGSRIQRAGMTSPTPVTSLTATELSTMAPTTLMAAVSQMPQFLNNQTPENTGVSWTGNAGASILNLRGIGANRTLVLLDGRRVVSSTRRGTVDISLLPESLVNRVDITTGGASAAYGSDAVSGVVNFMLDTGYAGLKGSVQGGISELSDNQNLKASLAAGMNLGERGHIVAALDHYKADAVESPTDRDWFESWGLIANPDPMGTPAQIIAPNVRSRQFTYGGLIVSGPLAGKQFLPGGATAPFESGALASANAQSGGDGVDLATIGALLPGIRRSSAFTHVTFDLDEDAQLFGQALYGNSFSSFNSPPAGAQYGSWPATIYRDNAFLPATIRDPMTTLNLDSFRLGRSGDLDYGASKGIEQQTGMISVTTGIRGRLGAGWRYNAYYQYGHTKSDITMYHAIRLDRLYKAIDAVVDPGSGQIVCHSTLTFPGDGCVPLDPFGVGSPSQAAIDYISTPRIDQVQVVQQHVFDATIQGEPFSSWAGPVSLATGTSYRRDSFNQSVYPTQLQADTNMPAIGEDVGYRGLPAAYRGIDNIFERGPSTSPRGGYYVWELFGEMVLPLATEAKFAHSLDLNSAVRYAYYEGSGGIMAWKLGLDWQPLADVRLRATASRDVRAGTLSERFDTTRGPGSVIDPFAGTNVPQVFSQIAGGNPDVDPEKADTLTFGVVYQPSWLPGVGLSADVYDIDIRDAIGQLTVQNIVDQCFAGVQSLCALITRDADGAISEIRNVFINIAQAKTRGVDVEAFYNRPITLFGGAESLRVRAFVTHVTEDSTVAQAGATKFDRAGQTGLAGGAPDWQANVTLGYTNGGFSTALQERYISGGLYNATYTTADINDNTVAAAYYTNLRLGYASRMNGGTRYEIYANVTNLFDRAPPLAPAFGFTGTTDTNTSLFDTIGRRYNLGFALKF